MSEVLHAADRAGLTLQEVAGKIDEVSTLPHLAVKVMEVAHDPGSGAADLKAVLERDPALSARLLRCVNSSAYAARAEITNLQQAIAYLGLKQVRNLALTAGVSDLFRGQQTIGKYSRLRLWRHLVSVAVAARMLAMRRSIGNFEDAFLAGLLHDIGILLEDQHVHDGFCAVIRSLHKDTTLAETERELLGFDHTTLGERVAADWGFPHGVTAAIRHHHASQHCRAEDIEVVRCVEVANLLCTLKGISSVGLKSVRVSRQALEGLALTKQDVVVLAEDLDGELSGNADLFEM